MSATTAIETDIPARMDRLPWSRFHLLIVVALGITWVLDGLEVTIVGSIGPALQDKSTLGLTPQDIGTLASAYVAGAVVGALFFGWLTDRFGRRLVFNVTLGLYVLRRAGLRLCVEFLVARRLPHRHGPGHRRRICRYQLRHRRTDPRPPARPYRPHRQR